ncbi:MAG TPA: ABC transporter transmembrane domain-containing protein, partial [Pseudomonadales bacterium]|nr:ABC transporter transmembrane domain-containing protein [Pseudomonadales bacterium]
MSFYSMLQSLQSLLRAQRPGKLLLFLLEALSTSMLQGISLLLIVPLLYAADLLPANAAAASTIPASLQPWLAHASLERVILFYLLVVGGYALLRFVQQHSAFALEETFIKQLRQRAVTLVCGARWETFRQRSHADMMQFINEETEKAGLLANQFFGFLAQAIALAILFAMSVWVSPMLTLVLGAWGVVTVTLMRPVNQAGQRAAMQLQQARRRILADIAHLLTGFKSLKVNHQEAQLADRLLATSEEMADARRRFFRLNNATGTGLELGGALTIVVVIYASIALGDVHLESLLSFVLLLSRLMPKANAVTSGWQRMGNLLATYQTLQHFLADLARQQEPETAHSS